MTPEQLQPPDPQIPEAGAQGEGKAIRKYNGPADPELLRDWLEQNPPGSPGVPTEILTSDQKNEAEAEYVREHHRRFV